MKLAIYSFSKMDLKGYTYGSNDGIIRALKMERTAISMSTRENGVLYADFYSSH